jgi:hypothetical protein
MKKLMSALLGLGLLLPIGSLAQTVGDKKPEKTSRRPASGATAMFRPPKPFAPSNYRQLQ